MGQALGGFGDPAVIFIASLFVVSSGLEITGVTAWAGQLLIRGAGEESRTRLLVLTMGLVALLTALISVNGAVAALLPVVVVIAVRLKRNSSQLLMPLVFAAHAGSKLALTGSPVNVLVSDAAVDAGVGGFGFFEFALVGVPLLAGTMVIIVLFGQRLLPERNGASMPADFSRHAKTLVEQYGLASGIYQCASAQARPMWAPRRQRSISAPIRGCNSLPFRRATRLAAAPTSRRRRRSRAASRRCRGSRCARRQMHLAFREEAASGQGEETLFNRRSGLAEVVIPPRSGLIGQSVFPGHGHRKRRFGRPGRAASRRRRSPPVQGSGMAAGSSCRRVTPCSCRERGRPSTFTSTIPNVLVVSSPDLVRRQAVPMGPGAFQAIAILVAMVLLLATGIVPPAVAGLLAAGAIILSGIMSVQQSYRAIDWTTVILVAAMMPLSTAMMETGAAKLMAEQLVESRRRRRSLCLAGRPVRPDCDPGAAHQQHGDSAHRHPDRSGGGGEHGHIAAAGADEHGGAAAAAFLTPIATPTNLMVMGPGGYIFSDYWKLGLPLLIWFFVVSVFIVPLIWRF